MMDYNKTIDQVLNMGFFEAHRLWLIGDEIKTRNLQYLSMTLDYANADETRRKEYLEWVHSKQPRRYAKHEIPAEVLKKFAKAFNNRG